MPASKLDNSPGKPQECLDSSCGRVLGTYLRLGARQLLLTMLVVVLSLLELSSGDLVKDPTAQVLLVDLRDAVGLFNEFHTLGLVLIAAYRVRLGFHQV